MSHKVLLAFSGGLDTSYCVLLLKSRGHEVHTVTVDTGGFSPEELARIESMATRLGAASHATLDAREELFQDYLRHLVAGNVLRGGLYPLSVSAERVCQARRAVAYAREIGATALAHGSTGAGNDQVRFDVAFRALAPELELMAPIRELAPSRAEERAFLEARGFPFPEKVEAYSVNEGMWGTSVGGKETHDSWQHLPEEAYPGGGIDPALAPKTIVLGFRKGVPVSLDGEPIGPVGVVQALNKLGSAYGIGRGIHLGDTIMGIKGRVAFEAPGAHLVIGAHRELEKLVLTGKQLFWKESLGNLYGSLLHEGHFFDPVARDLEAFLDSSQQAVTGDVRVEIRPYAFTVQGVRSPRTLMRKDLAAYGESTSLWSGSEAAGFAKVFGVPQMIALKAKE
ncbi:argininosuccinate synthase [Mesoterricola sediminis]|uniref:argininosuccinate synthase n=1 Tax=Mesoterricola sediminis TaxID=2927980 RepID=A0AA48H5T8_9BACT|nr:argininosuccinate synthase [Mesoterricola sediminis]BDU77926.1 argininosuccinate synthase [Mesoterricola sediminis]